METLATLYTLIGKVRFSCGPSPLMEDCEYTTDYHAGELCDSELEYRTQGEYFVDIKWKCDGQDYQMNLWRYHFGGDCPREVSKDPIVEWFDAKGICNRGPCDPKHQSDRSNVF
jgi:hypothetical protein